MTTTIERREARPLGGERSAPFALRSNDSGDGDGWTLDGYGAVFNRTTVIDSWEGVFREKIANRSMNKSFRENPPIVQFDHGRHPLIGSFPVADLKSAREEVDPELAPEGGAHIVADIFRHLFFEPLREALAAQAIRGMSFRFEVVKERWETFDGKVLRDDEELIAELRKTWRGDVPEEELPIRTLQELRVPEIGPVVWPAYRDTSVGVRSTVIDLGSLDGDPEKRAELARQLWAMPKAVEDEAQSRDESEPQSTEHEDHVHTAAEHSDERNNEPQSTGDEPAGEHSTPPAKARRAIDVTLSSVREMLRQADTRKDNSDD